MPCFPRQRRSDRCLQLGVDLNFASNHDERDGEDGGCDQRAKRVDGAKRKASEVPQRSDSERGNSVARLIKGDYFSRHHGRELRKRLPAEADAQREESRAPKTCKAECNDAT